MLRVAPFAALALLCACATGGGGRGTVSGGARPQWVDGESRSWPRAQYVTGLGSADDEAGAGERARGEISRVFSSAVSADTSLDESEANLTQDGRTTSSNSVLVAQKVRTVSAKLLEGVEIAERWKDPTGRWYALAVLSKVKAMQAVEEKMQALDAEAALLKGRLDGAADKFERAKTGARLANLMKNRLDLENDRRVLGGGALTSTVDAAAAKAAALRALAALDVIVAATGDGAEEVETGVVSGLNAAGLTAKRGSPGDAGDMVVEAVAAVEPLEGTDARWKWSRASATITLKDGRENKAFARFSPSEREAAGDARQARRRSLDSLAKKAAERVAAAISDYFNN